MDKKEVIIAEKTAGEQQTNIVKKKVRGKPFPPGVSGNPAGKPKGTKHFGTIFKEILEETMDHEGRKLPVGKIMSLAMTKKAMKGDVNAFREVADRVDGKAQQKIEMEAELTLNEGLTKEEKEALLKLLDGNKI